MQYIATDPIPPAWKEAWKKMESKFGFGTEVPEGTLQSWLEEVYFDGERRADLSREDIKHLGRIIGRLLCFEPGDRAEICEILEEGWFRDLD